MKVANRELLRAINRFSILNCIRTNRTISRIDIAKETGLSRASVTGITAELIKDNLILEKPTRQKLGVHCRKKAYIVIAESQRGDCDWCQDIYPTDQ